MKTIKIRSKYSFKSLWDVTLLSLGLLVTIVLATIRLGFGLETLSLLILLIGFCFWWMNSLVRYIIFDSSSFRVVRYIMPQMIINYIDVTDIGASKIKTKNGDISLAGMANGDKIIYQFNDLINQGKISRARLEKKLRIKEMVWRKSMIPSLIISLPLWIILFYFWPFDNMWFDSLAMGLAGGLIFFCVNSIVQWVVKKYLMNYKEI